MFRYLLLILMVSSVLSCETIIAPEELGQEDLPPIVISSLFAPVDNNPDYNFKVSVTQARSLLSAQDYIVIDDATVMLYSGETYIETLKYDEVSEQYYGTTKPELGTAYKLVVEHPDFETITARTRVPQKGTLTTTTTKDFYSEGSVLNDGFENYTYKMELGISDPPGEDNYYHLIFKNLVELTSSEPSEGGQTLRYGYKLVNFDSQSDFGKIAMIINSARTEVQDFRGLFFTDKDLEAFEDGLITISAGFSTYTGEQELEEVVIELRTVSKEYYNLFLSAYQQEREGFNPIGGDLTTVSSNIINGVGSFAGYTSHSKSVKLQ